MRKKVVEALDQRIRYAYTLIMTNQSMRATFGNKFITNSGLEHPEQLFTPAGSGMFELLKTPEFIARRVRSEGCNGAAELAFADHIFGDSERWA